MKNTLVWTALLSLVLSLALSTGGMNATNAGGVLRVPVPATRS